MTDFFDEAPRKKRSTLSFGAALSQGSWPVQEDGYLSDPSRKLFALADGFGGRGAGDMAAKLALDSLAQLPPSTGANGDAPSTASLRAAFQAANKQILMRNAERAPGSRGGASLLVASLRAGSASLLHTGSCAALLVRAGTLYPLLTPQAGPRAEYQSLLPDQALGLGEELRLESRELALEAGDLLLLVSGGLDWETEAFRASLFAALAERAAGSSLEPLARRIVESASLSAQGWNRAVLAAESS